MSEYQYYEFRAIDRPLTKDQMAELRSISSRAEITSTSLRNTYNYGDFRGNPDKLMETIFDAHVYVSNFGSCNFMLRLPQSALPVEEFEPYAVEEALHGRSVGDHIILEWLYEDEPDGEWVEGEEYMAGLLPIRDELIRGDHRSLYLGWLGYVQSGAWEYEADEPDEDEENGESSDLLEPPVPPGLGDLTAAQTALAEFLHLDPDLIEAAAAVSPKLAAVKRSSKHEIDAWVAQIPEQEIRSAMVRMIQGEGLAVQTEWQSRYHRSDAPAAPTAEVQRRTVQQLLAGAEEAETRRHQREKEEAQRKREEAQRKRAEHLKTLVPRFTALWKTADEAAGTQKAGGYEEATSLLVDLRDSYTQAGRRPDFDEAFARFWEKHGHRPALKKRFAKAGLVPD